MDVSAERGFLSGAATEAAPHLLDALITHDSPDGTVTLRITEVEAYAGQHDPASHAFRGPTPRTEVMFGPAGRLYVYRSHGLHWCANIVTGPEGEASAVLLRGAEVIDGIDLARHRRGPTIRDRDLARGPGRFCQALGVTGAHGGVDLSTGELRLSALGTAPGQRIRTGPRVGVSRAADRPWRFWLDGEATVSPYRASPDD
ncbi:DNA-3-methyladenine glycosylase [Nocardioides alcanivorans]|uniref:DNA-3-methyladenine glycosylase n=1 Tax=Nocardioides alcanivorans TaxID=2897352 RepID=UPI001F3C5B46|nr:DNA-3-methyladenine glycosylase [Nocardioides alcanivorans]